MTPTALKNTALLLVDVINDMDFAGSDRLLREAIPAAKRIATLSKRMRATGVPVVYVNDNFGHWQSNFNQQIERCIASDSPGREVASRLIPQPQDYFVLKPKHSGFYSTPLDVLLRFLEVDSLILTGFAADICVLYTANDAYMREFGLTIPSDCVASESRDGTASALAHMKQRLKARVCLSRFIR
jgi:nicotinamidase-related amidase